MSVTNTDHLLSKSSLAVIKNALADLCTHTELANLFEQYDFEKRPSALFSNKVQRAGAFLDHQDWTNPEIFQRLLNLLTHVFAEITSRRFGPSNVEELDSCKRIMKTLRERESVEWDGTTFASRQSAALLHVAEKVEAFNHDAVQKEIRRLLANVETDPDDVLTSAKSLIESICRAILHDYGKQPTVAQPDFAQLTKQTLGELRLLPDQVSNQSKGSEVVRRILQNMASVLQGLAELRNLYGDSHGKGPGSKGLEPRHARLMAGLAGSLAIFLLETHDKRKPTS